jgi:tetratricopeptide (TPR) repeat protein
VLHEAGRLFQNGAFAEAIGKLHLVPEKQRSGQEWRLIYGACLARTKRVSEALAVFSAVLEEDRNCHEALTWIAVLSPDPEKALSCALRAVKLRPNDPTGHGALGSIYLATSKPEDAIPAFSKAVVLAPDAPEHRHNMAHAYLMLNRHMEAIAQLKKAIELAPKDYQNYITLASTYTLLGMAGDALRWLEKALVIFPHNARIHSAIANNYAMTRNEEKAEYHHRRAVKMSPDARGAYGAWLINQGRFEESNRIFEQLVEEGSDPGFAYYSLMQSRKLKDRDEDRAFVGAMTGLLESHTLRPKGEMYLRYALGKANEQLGDFRSAMQHYDIANKLAKSVNHKGPPVQPSRFTDEHNAMRQLYESMMAAPQKGCATETPIFIIGMIRSGTTLLDQIVSSHPAVNSGGELRYWIEETKRLSFLPSVSPDQGLIAISKQYVEYAELLAGHNHRITDKMPLNYACAGIINLMMPNARFIHIRRNPIDTCLSIWTTYFGQGPIFAYDKAHIVAYYREYLKMMDYWRAKMPADRLLEIDYEDLVDQPEEAIPKVIEFLGLPWDDACLHHDRNSSAINTPSRWQARQPIYKSSLDRGRQYEPWLGEFRVLTGGRANDPHDPSASRS